MVLHPAMQQPRPATATGRDAQAELQRKEHEVSQLRMATIRILEQQVADTQAQYQQLYVQFEELKADFQYNLQLSSDRDAELEQADAAAAAAAADLAAKSATIAQLQAGLAKAENDARTERKRAVDAAMGFSLKSQQLQDQMQQQHANSAAALQEQKKQYESQQHELHRLLAKAEGQLDRQRRELSAGFLLQAQQIEAKHAAAAAEARAEAATAAALAEKWAAEAAAAHEQAVQHSKLAEAAGAEAREADAAALRTKAEAEAAEQQLKQQLTYTQGQLAQLQQQLQLAATEKQLQATELFTQISTLQQKLQEQQDKAAAAAVKQAREQEQQLQQLQQRLQAAVAKGAAQHADALETAAQLGGQLREMESQLNAMKAERDALQARLTAAVTQAVAAADAVADEAQQQILSLQQEASGLHATNSALHQALEEVHAAAASYQEQLVAAGERERELQRQLLQAQLRLEEQAEIIQAQQQAALALVQVEAATTVTPQHPGTVSKGPSAERLLQERDSAKAALQEAQQRLAAQEADLRQLRQQVQSDAAGSGPDTNIAVLPFTAAPSIAVPATSASSSAADATAAGKTLALSHNSSHSPHPQAVTVTSHQPPGGPSPEPSDCSTLDPDLFSALPSPLGMLPHTPGSGASFWLGSSTGFGQSGRTMPQHQQAGFGQLADVRRPQDDADGTEQHGVEGSSSGSRERGVTLTGRQLSASADAAISSSRTGSMAALTAQMLGNRRYDLSSLRGSLEEANLVLLGSSQAGNSMAHQPHLGLPGVSLQLPQQQHKQQQELAAALIAAEATNERLRAIIAVLRQEMEELQAENLTSAAPEASHTNDGAAAARASSNGRPHSVPPAGTAAAAQPASPAAAAAVAAGPAVVELAMLRAELSASDAELDHVLAHLAVLQCQVSTAAADGSQQHLQDGTASELAFLRERVSTLLKDNRRYRRQAMQLQLAASLGPDARPAQQQWQHQHAAGDASSPDRSQQQQLTVPQVGHSLHLQPAGDNQQLQQQSQQPGNDIVPGTDTDGATAAMAAAPELERLMQELASAEDHVALLSNENERLMDLSNSLRAECTRLKTSQALLCGAGSKDSMSPDIRASTLTWLAKAAAMVQPLTLPVPVPVPYHQPIAQMVPQLPNMLPPGPSANDASNSVGDGLGGQQAQWPLWQVRQQLLQQQQWPWQQQQQYWQQHQEQPWQPSQAQTQQPQCAQYAETGLGIAKGSQGLLPQQQQQPPIQQQFGQPQELQVHAMQPARPTRDNSTLALPPAAMAAPGASRGAVSNSSNRGNKPVTQRQYTAATQPAAAVTGVGTSKQSRPGQVVSSTSTDSAVGANPLAAAAAGQQQMGSTAQVRLAPLRRKRQQHQAGSAAASRQLRVRNYNITSDEEAAVGLAAATTGAVTTAARQSVLAAQAQQGQ